MTTAYILWDRKEKRVVENSGGPLIFSSSGDATTHTTGRLSKRVAAVDQGKTYDVLTVTIA